MQPSFLLITIAVFVFVVVMIGVALSKIESSINPVAHNKSTVSPASKSPLLASILSLILGGGGQVYLGQIEKGRFIILFMLFSVGGLGIFLGQPWIYLPMDTYWTLLDYVLPISFYTLTIFGMIDSYVIAVRMQENRIVKKWEFFWDAKTESRGVSKNTELERKVETVKKHIQESIPVNNPLNKDNLPKDSSSTPIRSINSSIVKKINGTQENQVVNIQIEPNETKTQAAAEIVSVPKGVVIKVKRIRTVEHTVNIEWTAAISGKGEIGLKQVVSASIQGEIQRLKGYVTHQTESTEYEITLDGEKHNQYKLIWIDVWLKGQAEIQDSNGNYPQPFQFRDRTELNVAPYTDT